MGMITQIAPRGNCNETGGGIVKNIANFNSNGNKTLSDGIFGGDFIAAEWVYVVATALIDGGGGATGNWQKWGGKSHSNGGSSNEESGELHFEELRSLRFKIMWVMREVSLEIGDCFDCVVGGWGGWRGKDEEVEMVFLI